MYRRPNARRAALSSGLALLLGAGATQQALAQDHQSDAHGAGTGAPQTGTLVQDSSGFEMVAPAAASPAPAAHHPAGLTEVNGFELLPRTAGADATPATARADAPARPVPITPAAAAAPARASKNVKAASAPESVVNGFELLPPTAAAKASPATAKTSAGQTVNGFELLPQTASATAAPATARVSAAAPSAAGAAGLAKPAPFALADAVDSGFDLLPAAPPARTRQRDARAATAIAALATPGEPAPVLLISADAAPPPTRAPNPPESPSALAPPAAPPTKTANEAPAALAAAEGPAPARPEPVILVAQADAPPASQAPAPAAAPPPPAPIPAPEPAAPPAPAPSAPAAPPPAAAAPGAPGEATTTAPSETPQAHPLGVVGRIVVQGNERIEPTTILSYLPIQVGDTVDAARIDLALKTLFRTDLFADVAIEMQGSDLLVKVSENPIINQVVFEGNHALKEDKLRDEVQIRPRGIFTRSKVEQDAQRIIELYRRSGRISATVTPKIVQLPQKRVDLIFEIQEGPKSGILHVNFIGNKAFGDNALRDVIVTRESHWYKFFQSNDNYDPDRLEYDREQLRKFYRNHGFYDFKVISAVAELAPDKNGFIISFTVDEGPKYHFGDLKVTTELKRLNGELLQALLPVHKGQLYEDERIEKATDALTYAAGANGFAFVDIRPRYVAHPETKTVDVTFDIKEGPRVYIERIDVVGNTQTLDRVIRRELRVSEGDAYNRVLVDRSRNQIKALGFFKDVDIEQLPGSAPDKTVLRVKVTEQPTGQLSFSLGYSSVEKLVGDVGITQTNFRGRGQTVDFQVSLGYLRKQISLSFTEPRFLDRTMSAGFDLYTYRYDYSTQASFQTGSAGLNLRTGFPINQYASIGLKYGVHIDNVSIPGYVINSSTGQCAAGYSQSLCDEVGNTFTSAIGYSVRWDRRNDPILPTRGFYVDFGQEFAGVGGGIRYVRTTADGAWYWGFTPSWIFSLQGRAGYINGWGGDTVRINDRFFEGGDTFRGFQIAGIGPRDVSLSSTNSSLVGDALGGKLFAIGTAELTVPTPIPQQYGIKTAIFSDFGTMGLLDEHVKRNPDGTPNLFIKDDLALRASVGLSVRWKSPMGPLEFDFSKVLHKAPYDRTETFFFQTSTRF
jgi:outer membrane protein insertion porin family